MTTPDEHQQVITDAEGALAKAREGAKKLQDHATNAVYYAERDLVAARAEAVAAARRADRQVAEVDDDHDPVNRPRHYTSLGATCSCGEPIECIQVTESMTFCLGNVIKYVWRAGLKGDSVKDLEKARWYITREINRLNGEG